jgi:AraC-like DNA-binding protein
VQLRTADAENFHVNLPIHGPVSSSNGCGDSVVTRPGEGLVFSPGAPAEMRWSADCTQLCLMVPRARLEAELEQLLGRSLRGRLVFDFAADLHRPLGRRWRTLLDLILEEPDQPTEFGQDPRVLRHLESLVLDGLLLGQKHSHSVAAERGAAPGLSAAVRRAVEMIEERPAEPWTTVRLATEVHLSVRALQAGFSRDLAAPPMTYLRQVRLRRARTALMAAEHHLVTVRSVAAGLGILHMGRFAAAYREAFGESPSDTLTRPV